MMVLIVFESKQINAGSLFMQSEADLIGSIFI